MFTLKNKVLLTFFRDLVIRRHFGRLLLLWSGHGPILRPSGCVVHLHLHLTPCAPLIRSLRPLSGEPLVAI